MAQVPMSRDSTLSECLKMTTPPDQPKSKSRRILSSLLSRVKSDPSYKRFSVIVNGSQQLEELMYHCVRIDIIAFVDDGKVDSIKSRRNDDTSYSGKAIYLHVVEVFGVKRFYVGQARNLHKRIQDHMSSEKRQKEPSSLHYYALKHSTSDYYITLSYIPDANTCHGLGIRGDLENDSHLFLDLLETWCCLLFQALPKKYLEEFLPQDIPIHNPACRGLNIHLPLHGPALSNPGWHKIREIVRESSDRLYEDYLYDQALKFHSNNQQLVKHREAGLQICESLDGIPNNSSTPSRTTLPSPLSTKSKPVKYRPQSEAAKQVQPSTPCYPKSGRATNLPLDDASPYSKPADVGASNTDTSEQKKRKRDGDSLTEGDRLTKNRVNRILF